MGWWTCQRVQHGEKCRTLNPPRQKLCSFCHKHRPDRKKPAHLRALEIPYETYVELNGGEHCGICGKTPQSRRLDRDHDHKTGRPRGLLCWACNRQLRTWATVEWLRNAATYLERAA